ncbi:hypothetical protein Aduo_002998 [Ancylostoma duodenale]
MQLLSAVIVLLVVGEIAATLNYQCWNFKSTDEIREKYDKTINNLRAKIAKNEQKCKNGNCPQGKNIYKLNWDCLLENQAQKVVDKCKKNEKAPDDLGMVLTQVKLDTCNAMPQFKKTVEGWWNVVENATVNSNNPLLNSPDLQSFATLAHGAATRVGCAQKNCNGELFIACMVYKKGPADGEPIYEVGQGCSSPNDCETYEGSKCNSNKMCVAGYIDPTKTTTTSTTTPTTSATSTATEKSTTNAFFPGDNTRCKGQTHMSSDTIRQLFEDEHNKHRSEVARAQVKMGPKEKLCRNATQMWKLEYDCNLEKSAYTVAQNCADSESKTSDVDEVWHVFNGNSLDATNAANKAITAWFDEIKTGFMKQATGSQNQFLPALKIPMFAKMIWESHKKIGCAIVKCTSATKVVCHYSPADARLGNTIYAMGPTCNRCGYLGAKCSTDTLSPGLCMK